MSLLTAAATELEAFLAFASELRTEEGQPLVLEEFQHIVLRPYFNGVRQTVILLPKKNGKTTLIAALALFHLLRVRNATCVIIASSRKQAEIVLNQARMFVRQSDDLSKLMRRQERTIRYNEDDGRIEVLAADVDTADGVIPTLVIVDELHRAKSLELYGVMMDSLEPRQAQLIAISTAGYSLDSPLGQIRTAAHEHPSFTRTGTFNSLFTSDLAFFEWCLDVDANVEDFSVVKTANPASWQTEEALAKRRRDPGMTLYRWLRFACGVWTEGEEPWINPPVWDALAGKVQLEGPVWAAVDMGVREEEPAIVLVGRQGDKLLCTAKVMPVGTEMEQIEEYIRGLSVHSVSYEPRQFGRSAEMLQKEGFLMIEFSMSLERMSKASMTLWRLIERQEIMHDGDLRFRAHVMGGVVKEDGRGWRIQRDPKTRRPVAALMALMMAVQAASDSPAQEALMAWA